MGPAWYSRESARYLFDLQLCRPEHCKCYFRASEHAPPDTLRQVYDQIAGLVEECFKEDAYSIQVEVKDFTKRLFLQMQGSWLKRSSLQWHADRSTCSDDARGPVQKTRELADGSLLLFGCTEQLDNRTMYLVGLQALHHDMSSWQSLLASWRRGVHSPAAWTACIMTASP
jgi:hypothetical protein